ncbi:MAG: undecaprenyl-phosphate glucose phosphotransferase [Gammaproteobacteria bacterium]|nr:undecaprenyl-phosphate glucose phosphotransferase [Gammaproteobacteria bacterium]
MFRHDLNRDYQSLFRFFLFCFDIVLVVLAGVLAHYIRFQNAAIDYRYWQVLGLALVVSLVIFRWCGLYKPLREKRLLSYLLQGTFAIFLVFSVLSVFGVLSKSSVHYSRLWVGYWLFFLWAGFVCSRLFVYALLSYLRYKGVNAKRIIVIGVNARAQALVKTLCHTAWSGVKPVLFFSESEIHEKSFLNIPVETFELSRLREFVHSLLVDEVWIVLPLREEVLIKSIAENLMHEVVAVRYVPDFMGLSFRRHTMTEISGYPLINLYATPMEGGRRWLKAIEDRSLALLFLLIASPLILLISLLIKITSPGPVFFKQQRHGWNGKKFMVYKFRSMVVHQEQVGVVSQAIKNDSRITKIGRILRRTSFDELPQLLNVLQGDMSIVGPRPHAVEHNEYYKDLIESYMQRFKVKPGITGWAQVNGYRGETDTLEKMQRRVEYDLFYIENWTLLFDIRIVFLTLWHGFFHRNAY